MATRRIQGSGIPHTKDLSCFFSPSWPSQCKFSPALRPTAVCADRRRRTFTCISVVPIANRIVFDLDGHASKSASVLLVTIWELGEAAGPLFIAPLSEIFGRYMVMNAANLLFIVATIRAALSENTTTFIAARALTGLAVASNVLNPAIVGDIFASHERGSAMSLIMLAPLLGGAVGPAAAGAIAQKFGWRAVIWMGAGVAGVCEFLFLTCFGETYEVTILKRRAVDLRQKTGDDSLRTAYDEDEEGDWKKLLNAIWRPIIVLAGSGVLQSLSLYGAVSFTYFYVLATTLSDVLEDVYKLPTSLTGVSFMSFSNFPFQSNNGTMLMSNRYWRLTQCLPLPMASG